MGTSSLAVAELSRRPGFFSGLVLLRSSFSLLRFEGRAVCDIHPSLVPFRFRTSAGTPGSDGRNSWRNNESTRIRIIKLHRGELGSGRIGGRVARCSVFLCSLPNDRKQDLILIKMPMTDTVYRRLSDQMVGKTRNPLTCSKVRM